MPHLVSGHVRFTEDDSMKSDYYEKIHLESMNEKVSPEITRLFHKIFKKEFKELSIPNNNDNTKDNHQKKVLSDTLFSLLSLANTMGYTIDDLMKYKLYTLEDLKWHA